MKPIVAGIAALLIGAACPTTASAESFHNEEQYYDVHSNAYNITCIYEFKVQIYNTGIRFGDYFYLPPGGFLDVDYEHWIYDYSKGAWDFVKVVTDYDVFIPG